MYEYHLITSYVHVHVLVCEKLKYVFKALIFTTVMNRFVRACACVCVVSHLKLHHLYLVTISHLSLIDYQSVRVSFSFLL